MKTDEDIVQFSRQSVTGFSQNFKVLITGSLADLPLLYYLEHPSDIDILSWRTDIRISPEGSPIPKQFAGQFYKLKTYNSPPGYARIIAYQNSGEWTYCGRQSRLADPNNGPAVTTFRYIFCFKVTTDLVIGLQYSIWPSNAVEWKERSRYNDWPSNEVIREIVNDGCHLVLKPHPSHPDDDNEWRFSFSVAESTLVHTWNDVQLYIYRTLRLIKSYIVENAGGNEQTILRTYHFKTLMFWACEEEPRVFWQETCIEIAVKELLGRMIEWLIEKRCPNYFIPSCNLFDGQINDFQKEIDMLISYAQGYTLDLPQSLKIKNSFRLSFPRKFILVVQLCLHSTNFVNPLKPESVMSSLSRLARSPLLQEEMQWLFKAISITRDIHSDCCNGESKASAVQEALRCFLLANSDCTELDSFPVTIRLCDNVYGFITDYGFVNSRHINGKNNETMESNSNPNRMDKNECFLDMRDMVDVFNHRFVKPSHFLSAAYEANFHYTVLHDYHRAMQICDETFEVLHVQNGTDVLHLDVEWVTFSSSCFSIVITDEWIRLFDEAIVVTTGFLTLCSVVKTTIGKLKAPSKTSLYFRQLGCLLRLKEKLLIRINPIHFLRYIRLQCLRLLGLPQMDSSVDFNDFLKVCFNASYRMSAPQNVSEMIERNRDCSL